MRDPEVAALTLLRIQHMPFKLIPEMPNRRSHRPRRRITQWANRIALDAPLYIPKQIDVTHLALSVFDILQHTIHPARAFPARRALPATFMHIEMRETHRMTHHTLVFIQHNKSARTHHRTRLETTFGQAFIAH